MSDESSTNGKKDKKEAEHKPRTEPFCERPDLVQFLAGFWGGSQSKAPDMIELWTVKKVARGKVDRGTRVRQFPYPPSAASHPKTNEEIVEFANVLLGIMQVFTNESGQKLAFGVYVYVHGSAADYAGLHTIKREPTEKRSGDGSDEDDALAQTQMTEDEDDLLPQGGRAALLAYSLRQNRQALEDRRFYIKEMAAMSRDTNAQLRETNEKLMQQQDELFKRSIEFMKATEELYSKKHERDLQLKWTELGVRTADKTVDIALSYAAPVIAHLVGRKNGPPGLDDQITVDTVKRFIENSTPDQARAAFGYQGEDKLPLDERIFTKEQCELLGLIASGQTPRRAAELLPGGPLEIKMEQFLQIQAVYPREQLYPLRELFISLTAKQDGSNGSNGANIPPPSPKPE